MLVIYKIFDALLSTFTPTQNIGQNIRYTFNISGSQTLRGIKLIEAKPYKETKKQKQKDIETGKAMPNEAFDCNGEKLTNI